MTKLSFKPPRLPAALMIVSAAIFTYTGLCWGAEPRLGVKPKFGGAPRLAAEPLAQQSPDARINKHNTRPGESTTSEANPNDPKSATAQAKFSYEFSQPEFFIRHIVIEHNEKGAGKITFERKGEETSIEEPIEISPAAWSRILSHWQALQFLDSDTDYQADKQFPHLGTMRLSMIQGTRQRTAEFNWSNNSNASALVNEYRKVADQAIFVFDVSVARENQPLNTPKLMEHLESLMKRNWLSDPQQLIPLLKEVSIDEHLPLIARNHAGRLLKKLEK